MCDDEKDNYLDIADNLPTPAAGQYEAIARGCEAMAEHLRALAAQGVTKP